MVRLTTSKRMELNRNSSKGNQLKWYDGTLWYKADYLGYEALSEYLVSHLLKMTNIRDYVLYEFTPIEYLGKTYNGCQSADFLKSGQEILTLEKLFRLELGIDLTQTLAPMGLTERIQYTVDEVIKITGLTKFGAYLTMLLEMDAFFLNEDRHMNNIAVLRNEDATFSYCPVFDNGASLFSDTSISYPLDMSLDQCYAAITAKPFNRSFDEQVDVAEELYGVHFHYQFHEKDILSLLDTVSVHYEESVRNRVLNILREQIRRYHYFRR